jgi:creatinine amidohydrolase
MQKSFLAHMTWEEFRDSVTPETVVVIPMGSMELEGPHLPLGVDTIVAEAVAGELDGEDGIVIGPTIPIGYSKWFKPFPGTISLESDTLTRVIVEYCHSLIDHGIQKLVFLNSHRGNNAAIEVAARNLIAEKPVRVGMLSIWKLANDLIAGKGLIDEGKFTHAGEIMTSVIMAVKPETLVMEKIRADSLNAPEESEFVVKNSLGDTLFRNAVQTVYHDIREITDTGTMGAPETASADKGQAVLTLILEYVRAFLQEFRKLQAPLKRKP